MKKASYTVIFFSLLLLSIVMNVSSECVDVLPVIISDSGQITDEELSMLEELGWRNQVEIEDYLIVKTYCGNFLHAFADEVPLNSLLRDGYIEEIQYALWSKSSPEYNISYFGVSLTDKDFEAKGSTRNRDFDECLFQCAFSYSDIFDSTLATEDLNQLKVNEKYIFDAKYETEGVFIYYVTSCGDFVYYMPNPHITEVAYLMPYEEFCDLSKIVYENFDDSRGYGAQENVEDLYDLSKYKVGSVYIRRTIIMSCVGLIIIITCTIVFIIRQKRKKTITANEPQDKINA